MIEFLTKGLMLWVLITGYLAIAYVCYWLIKNAVEEIRINRRKNVRKEKE